MRSWKCIELLDEKEGSIQTLNAQLVEREQVLQSVSAQLQDLYLEEKDRILREMTSSKVWKLALLFRQARLVLVPPNSRRARLLRVMVNGFMARAPPAPWGTRAPGGANLIRASSF